MRFFYTIFWAVFVCNAIAEAAMPECAKCEEKLREGVEKFAAKFKGQTGTFKGPGYCKEFTVKGLDKLTVYNESCPSSDGESENIAFVYDTITIEADCEIDTQLEVIVPQIENEKFPDYMIEACTNPNAAMNVQEGIVFSTKGPMRIAYKKVNGSEEIMKQSKKSHIVITVSKLYMFVTMTKSDKIKSVCTTLTEKGKYEVTSDSQYVQETKKYYKKAYLHLIPDLIVVRTLFSEGGDSNKFAGSLRKVVTDASCLKK